MSRRAFEVKSLKSERAGGRSVRGRSPATLRPVPSEPREDPIVGGVRSAPFSTAVSLASGRPLAGEGAELPADEQHPPPRPPGEGTARVLEILSQRARRCSRSRSSLRGLTQRSRPVSSSSSLSSSSSSSLRPSPPRNTLSSGRVTLPRSGVGGGTSYVDLRLTGTPRTSLACVAGSLARVDRGRHRQLPMRAGFGGERYEL